MVSFQLLKAIQNSTEML